MAFIKKIQEYLKATLAGKEYEWPQYPLLATGEHLLLWGATEDAIRFHRLLATAAIPVSAIIDTPPHKNGGQLAGVSVRPPEAILTFQPSVILISSRRHNLAIASQLHEMGYLYDIHFAEHPLATGEESFISSFFDLTQLTPDKEASREPLTAEEERLQQRLEAELYPLLPATADRGWLQTKNRLVTAEDLERPYK